MPAKYTQRDFIEGGLYHIYNASRENLLFRDETDYKTFLFYLYIYVRPIKSVLQQYENLPFRLQMKNLHKEVDILTYCLMPDHFHLLLRQTSENGIQKLLKQVTNAYTEYFNKKYKLAGPVVRGRYKSVAIEKEKHLLLLSRFIHLNPVISAIGESAQSYPWSSIHEYEETRTEGMCSKRLILSYYSSAKEYIKYVNDFKDYESQSFRLKDITIEDF